MLNKAIGIGSDGAMGELVIASFCQEIFLPQLLTRQFLA